MKMRDKKKKKVNRIVKAGLALLCAGALLGGAVFGGSVRVKADGNTINIIGINSSAGDNGDYSDIYYYLEDSNGSVVDQDDNAEIQLSDENASKQSVTPKMNYHIIVDSRRSNFWDDYGAEIPADNASNEYGEPISKIELVKAGIKSVYDNAKQNQCDMTLAFSSILDSNGQDDNYTYALLENGDEDERYDDALGQFASDRLGATDFDAEYLTAQINKDYSESACDVYVIITDGSETIPNDNAATIKKALNDEVACFYWVDIDSENSTAPYGDIAKKIELNGWSDSVIGNHIQCLRISNVGIEDATLTDAQDYEKGSISVTLKNGDNSTYSGDFYLKKTSPETNDDSTISVENISFTGKNSLVFFASKDTSDGYAIGRNEKLYKSNISLSASDKKDIEASEKPITYNLIWDLGAESYEENVSFDDISSKINELSQPEETINNKVKIMDCDGESINFDNEVSADSKKKLTGENLKKLLNSSKEQTDAYVIVTDTKGIENTKEEAEKTEEKLIYYINVDDESVSTNGKNVKEITGNAETGVDKWENAKNMIASSVCFSFDGVELTTVENGDSTTPVSITVDSINITNVNIYVVDDNKNIIVKIWSKLKLWQKILIIAGAAVVVVFIVIMIIVSARRKKSRKRKATPGGIPHGSPSSSPDVQLRSGVSPTAQTNVLARRAGEQNMQGMQNTVPANNTKQIQIQIIGRNPKIINTYINGSIFVGRANTCDVFINDATISRQHFALECVNGEVFIQPLVATNGTKLNGQRINDKHPLYPNDRIQIGTIGIVVRW